MVSRPRFDFEGSLELCRQLVTLGGEINGAVTSRNGTRDVALAPGEFQGPYGDDHRARADGEDLVSEGVVEAILTAPKAWTAAWQAAADQMNAYAALLAQKDCDALYEAAYSRWLGSGYTDHETGQVVGRGPRPSKGSVTPPKGAPLPAAPGYDGGLAFAKYEPAGLDMVATYVASPPV